MSKRICLGKITTAHGIRGFVKIQVYADDPRSLEKTPLYKSELGADTLSLRLKNSTGKFWLAEIDGVKDRNAAETLRNVSLWVERDTLPVLESTAQYYINDLVGLKVQDEKGAPVGAVIAVQNFGAGDLLEILPPSGEAFFLPFTKDTVIAEDLEKGVITVSIPEGWL